MQHLVWRGGRGFNELLKCGAVFLCWRPAVIVSADSSCQPLAEDFSSPPLHTFRPLCLNAEWAYLSWLCPYTVSPAYEDINHIIFAYTQYIWFVVTTKQCVAGQLCHPVVPDDSTHSWSSFNAFLKFIEECVESAFVFCGVPMERWTIVSQGRSPSDLVRFNRRFCSLSGFNRRQHCAGSGALEDLLISECWIKLLVCFVGLDVLRFPMRH